MRIPGAAVESTTAACLPLAPIADGSTDRRVVRTALLLGNPHSWDLFVEYTNPCSHLRSSPRCALTIIGGARLRAILIRRFVLLAAYSYSALLGHRAGGRCMAPFWSALATSSVFKNPHLLINMRSADLDTEKYISSSRFIFSQRVSGTSANPNGWMGGGCRAVHACGSYGAIERMSMRKSACVRPQRGPHARKARSNRTTSWRWSELSDHN